MWQLNWLKSTELITSSFQKNIHEALLRGDWTTTISKMKNINADRIKWGITTVTSTRISFLDDSKLHWFHLSTVNVTSNYLHKSNSGACSLFPPILF